MSENKICGKCTTNIAWFDFIFTKQWALAMTGVKIIAMITLIIIGFLFFTEIQAVKFLNYDQCAYCIEKTGASCFNFGFEQVYKD